MWIGLWIKCLCSHNIEIYILFSFCAELSFKTSLKTFGFQTKKGCDWNAFRRLTTSQPHLWLFLFSFTLFNEKYKLLVTSKQKEGINQNFHSQFGFCRCVIGRKDTDLVWLLTTLWGALFLAHAKCNTKEKQIIPRNVYAKLKCLLKVFVILYCELLMTLIRTSYI